jgi:hypothetical protein
MMFGVVLRRNTGQKDAASAKDTEWGSAVPRNEFFSEEESDQIDDTSKLPDHSAHGGARLNSSVAQAAAGNSEDADMEEEEPHPALRGGDQQPRR